MNNLTRIFIAGVLLAIYCSDASAQTKKDSAMHQTMTIERNFSPIVRDHNKIDQQPAIPEIKIKKSPTRYSDWMAGEAISRAIGTIRAGQVIAVEEPFKNGFVELSAGNYFNTDLKAGVQLNEEFSLELDGFFTKGNLELPDSQDLEWESRFLNGNAKLNYNHFFTNGGLLRAYVLAGGRNYNMFVIDKTEKQKLGRIWANVGYEQNDWDVDLTFRHNSLDFPDIDENIINVKPGYRWAEDDWQLRLTLDLALKFDGKKPFTFCPELEFSKYGYGLNRFYVLLNGGTVRPNLYELMDEFPLLLPFKYEPEKNIFDLTLGYEDNSNGSLKWGVFAGGKMTLDRLDGYMTNFSATANFSHGCLRTSDEFEFKAGAYFDFQHNKLFGMKGAANFSSNPRFGKPMLDANLHFLFNPIRKLNLDFGMDTDIKREMEFWAYPVDTAFEPWLYEPIVESIDLKNIFGLNLRADYQLLPNLDIFLFGKNLLNQEYQLWAGVPAQKINIHAGFNWRF